MSTMQEVMVPEVPQTPQGVREMQLAVLEQAKDQIPVNICRYMKQADRIAIWSAINGPIPDGQEADYQTLSDTGWFE